MAFGPGQIPWPSTEIVTDVIRDFQPDTAEYVGLGEFPIETNKYLNSPDLIKWDIIGPHQGMTYPHALGSDPRLVKPSTLKTKTMHTAYWREIYRLNEADMLMVRNVGPKFMQRMAGQLIVEGINKLDIRLFTRLEWLAWQVLTTGMLTINENGVIRTIDYEVPNTNRVVAANLWSDYDNSDPIANLQQWSQLGVPYGATLRTIYVNMKTMLDIANNSKVRSLVEKSTNVVRIGADNVGALVMQLAGVPGIIKVYDKGYLNDAGTFTRFIPNGRAVLRFEGPASMGKFAEFASTPSLFNGGIQAPTGGRYIRTKDESQNMMKPHYDIMEGIHGLPVVFHPDWLVIADV